ncbi:hypothetical protein D6D85_02260 [Candidatus Methanodesulfokora washburnensis]|uniref:Uncharacterized protein n=1 Tax=Candidatus Methanodesulfokora washburnensis TaxID=2478471 RepID=A0A3R9QZY1_9CREN|nr:hypothetical protein D6D85_02260 [Candidatus Methanodesulfokores washburnensis]
MSCSNHNLRGIYGLLYIFILTLPAFLRVSTSLTEKASAIISPTKWILRDPEKLSQRLMTRGSQWTEAT